MNVVDYLLDNDASPDQVALLSLTREYTYGALRSAVQNVARFLIQSGLQKGDRVALVSENSFFWVVSYLATLLAGGVSVPLPTNIASDECAHVLQSADIRFAFLQPKTVQECLSLFGRGILAVVDTEDEIPSGVQCSVALFEKVCSATSRLPSSLPAIEDQQDLAALMFTSGSTQKPRGVMISHRNIIANTSSIIAYLGITAADRIMVVLPFCYCFGTSLLHTHIRAGGSLVIDPRFMFPDKVLERMRETECTGFAGVPSHYQILLRNSNIKRMRFPELRYVQQAGGKLPNSFIQELCDVLPDTAVFIMYGQTEATARLSYLPPTLLGTKLGSIGKGIPGVKLQVLNDHGEPVSPGAIGEIVAQGENIAFGYWREDKETVATFRGGRLFTGDLATVDDQGYIYIVDRAKDFIKCGGLRVSCKQVEETLLEFDGTLEAAVVGIPDDILGEAIKAFIVHHDGNIAELPVRIEAFCRKRLPPHLQPKEIQILDSLPKNQAGKVMKTTLKTM